MRDHGAYGLVVCPSSATVSSSTEAANRAVRCQALLLYGYGRVRESPVWPVGAWAERALCVCGGWGGGGDDNSVRGPLNLMSKWGALVLSVAYHCAALQCAALYRYAVLGFQPRL